MTPSVFDRANAVGKYAAKLIFDLQREYTAESGSNARSRARLARLRRDLDGTAPTWMSIGEELFAQWPQELEAPADDSPEFDRQVNAVKVALELYAVHQQSKGQGVAQKYQTDPSSRMTFGRACRRITPDPEQAKGVLGKRTKGVVTLIADSITSKRPDLAESAEGLAQKVMAAAGFKVKASDRAGADKGSLATDYLIFIANNEIDKLADLAIAAFDEGEDVSKMKKEVSAIFHGPQAVDIALFGRMLADAPDLNTDASAQVAHAFSIDQITPEYDYFTAVDDCASEDNAGAAMIDTVGFNSSTLYRYATVNIDVLRDQLQDDSATVEGVVAFVEAFVKSMPSGKQNTFANHTLPEDVVVTLRESQPISAADAFEDPVRRKDGISVSRQGVERLGERLNDIRVNYGEEPVKAWYVATGGAVSSLNEWCEQVSLPDLEQSLKETLNAAYSA